MTRTVLVVMIVAVVLLGAVGCGPSVSQEVNARNDRLAAQLAEHIRAMGDYLRVEASYIDDATSNRSLDIDIKCRRCHPERTLKKVLGMAWQSQVTPLNTLVVSVVDIEIGERVFRYVDVSDRHEVQEMVEKYGKRPVESNPSY